MLIDRRLHSFESAADPSGHICLIVSLPIQYLLIRCSSKLASKPPEIVIKLLLQNSTVHVQIDPSEPVV